MSQPDPSQPISDAELPPDAKRVVAQARRFFVFSMAILLVGFIAIAGVLVYRASRDSGGGPADRYAANAVTLPAGANLVSVSTGEGLITLGYRLGDTTAIRIFDARSGALLKQIAVINE